MLIESLSKIQFKGSVVDGAYAYVLSRDSSLTIHLCELFFEASEILGVDSQPGTLIHEVSHFVSALGLKDYSKANILDDEYENFGNVVLKREAGNFAIKLMENCPELEEEISPYLEIEGILEKIKANDFIDEKSKEFFRRFL